MDIEGLEAFSKEFNESINAIHLSLSVCNNDFLNPLNSMFIDVGVTYAGAFLFGTAIPGVGGLIAGFRDHGVKGAVIGGLSGAAVGLTAAAVAMSFGVVGIPLALIMGAVSSFGGKAMTDLVFGKKDKTEANVEKIRESMLLAVTNMLGELKGAAALENWLKETCESSYNSIADDIDREWENSLESMENTLTQIKIDLEMGSANKTKTENDLKTCAGEISEVISAMKPIKDRLSQSLQS